MLLQKNKSPCHLLVEDAHPVSCMKSDWTSKWDDVVWLKRKVHFRQISCDKLICCKPRTKDAFWCNKPGSDAWYLIMAMISFRTVISPLWLVSMSLNHSWSRRVQCPLSQVKVTRCRLFPRKKQQIRSVHWCLSAPIRVWGWIAKNSSEWSAYYWPRLTSKTKHNILGNANLIAF